MNHFENPEQIISTILKHDRKINSYKIALLRSMNDIVYSYPDAGDSNKPIAVPLRLLAEFWLAYYWPFINSLNPIYQGPRSKRGEQIRNDMAFRDSLSHLFRQWEDILSVEANPSDWFYLRSEFRIPRRRKEFPIGFQNLFDATLKAISESIKMPIRYAGIGEWEIFGKPLKLSQIKDAQPLPGAQPQDTCLLIPNNLWQGFHRLSLYIEALCIHQWSLFVEGVKQDSEQIIDRGVIYKLLTDRPDNRRPLTWERNRIDILILEGKEFTCPWTEKTIKENVQYDLDHIVPISVYPVNELWNLVPSDPKFNSDKKRDRMPGKHVLDKAQPYLIDTYQIYQFDNALQAALIEDAVLRFSQIQPNNRDFTNNLSGAVINLISQMTTARNLATF